MSKLLIQKNPQDILQTLASGESKKCVFIYTENPDEALKNIFNLSASGSDLELLLLIVGSDNISFNINLQVNHIAPSCRSRVSIKSILSDSSTLKCTGNVFVGNGAENSDTFLQCDSILLSEKSKVKATPSLEIIANDIKAGHSATIGQIDDDKLFYLLSRGFSRKAAVKMLLEAFFLSSLNSFTHLSEEDALLLKEELMEISLLA